MMLWIVLTIVSALSAVGVLVINKKLMKKESEINNSVIYFFVAAVILLPAALLTQVTEYRIDATFWVLIGIAAIVDVAAIYLYMRSIRTGHMSVSVPIRNTTPLFTAILAIVFLSEIVTARTIISILLIVAGVLFLRRTSIEQFFRRGVLDALLVAFLAAIVLVITKHVVTSVNPLIYALVKSILSLTVLLVLADRHSLLRFMRRNAVLVVAAGILASVSMISNIYAVSLVQVSVQSAFRRVELLFAVIAGAIFFREQITLRTVLASAAVFIGLVIII